MTIYKERERERAVNSDDEEKVTTEERKSERTIMTVYLEKNRDRTTYAEVDIEKESKKERVYL